MLLFLIFVMCFFNLIYCQLLTTYEEKPFITTRSSKQVLSAIPANLLMQYLKDKRGSNNLQPIYRYNQENIPEVNYFQKQSHIYENLENYPTQLIYRDYDETVKHNNAIEFRKKLDQQYLKEVPPTTQTIFQTPIDYLGYDRQRMQIEQGEDIQKSVSKSHPHLQYILQPDVNQRHYFSHQEEKATKPTTQSIPYFNLVTSRPQPKILENIRALPKSSIYVSQNNDKSKPNTRLVIERPQIQIESSNYYARHQQLAPVRFQKPIPEQRQTYQVTLKLDETVEKTKSSINDELLHQNIPVKYLNNGPPRIIYDNNNKIKQNRNDPFEQITETELPTQEYETQIPETYLKSQKYIDNERKQFAQYQSNKEREIDFANKYQKENQQYQNERLTYSQDHLADQQPNIHFTYNTANKQVVPVTYKTDSKDLNLRFYRYPASPISL